MRVLTKPILLIFISFLLMHTQFLFYLHSISAQNNQKNSEFQDIEQLIKDGIDATIKEDYDLAQLNFNQIIFQRPEDPAGYFFLGSVYQMQMMDYASAFKRKDFFKNMRKSIKLAEKRIEKDEADIWAHFYLGNSYGALAIYEGKRGRLWKGFKYALKAKSAIKKAVKLDSTFYDCYVGLGSYHYWTSVITKPIHFLPFFKDERKRGIEELKIAGEKSIYSKEAANYGLIWIYIEEKHFGKAIKLAEKMDKKYPETKLFLWPIAEAYYLKKDWVNSIFYYQKLLKKIGNPDKSRYINTIECRYRIAESFYRMGKKKECIKECERILSYRLDKDIEKRLKDQLKKTKNLLKKCLE